MVLDLSHEGFTIDSGDARFDLAQLAPQKSPDQEFSEHFSEGSSIKILRAKFPHTPLSFSDAIQASFEGVEAFADKVVPALKASVLAVIRWTVRVAVAGLAIRLATPWVGMFGHLEVWAVPFLMTHLGLFGGLAIGAVYHVVRWYFAN